MVDPEQAISVIGVGGLSERLANEQAKD